jgi:leader peptidase (prepilin peptidase) / N-methyltransferase
MKLLIFILGTIFGSFYLVVGTRLPNNEEMIKSRSHCDNCGHVLSWYELIPIISFIFLKGKCKSCHKPISIMCPMIEIITGLLFLEMYLLFGISYEFYTGLIVSSLLVIIFISDFLYLIILDSPLIVSSILIFILKYLYFGFTAFLMSLLSGIILFVFMYLLKLFGDYVFKKESLGGGDIKFSFVIGIVLGVKLGFIAIVLSSFLALPVSIAALIKTKNNEVPFGPFLSGALFMVFVFMPKFINLVVLLFP